MGVCAARLTMSMRFPRLAFDTTMPAAREYLVCASVFGELPIPLGKGNKIFIIKLGMRCGDFKGAAPQAARNDYHLRNRVPGSHVHGTGRFAEDQVDWARVPFGFDQPACDSEAVSRTVQRGQEKAIQPRWRSPDIRQVKLEEVLLILAIEEAETRLAPLCWAGIRSRVARELVRIAREGAVRIVEDIEQPRIGEAAVGLRLLQRRPKRATSRRQLVESAQPEPNRRWDQDTKGAGRRERKTLLANPIAGRNGRAGARRRDAWQPYVRYERHDGEGGGIDRHGKFPVAPAGSKSNRAGTDNRRGLFVAVLGSLH